MNLKGLEKYSKAWILPRNVYHDVLAWKSGIKSAAWMLSWDFNSFFLRYFNNRRLLLRLVVCFMLHLTPVKHLAVGNILITFLAEVTFNGMSRTGSCREKKPEINVP